MNPCSFCKTPTQHQVNTPAKVNLDGEYHLVRMILPCCPRCAKALQDGIAAKDAEIEAAENFQQPKQSC